MKNVMNDANTPREHGTNFSVRLIAIIEIITISYLVSLLGFFGTMFFYPMEVNFLGERQSAYWMIILVSISACVAYIFQNYLKQHSGFIKILLQLASFASAFYLLISFLQFSSNNMEPWLMQGAWFIRYEGFPIGVFLGITFLKSNMISSHFMSQNQKKHLAIGISLLIGAAAGFYALWMIIFRYYLMGSVIIFIVIIEFCLSLFSVITHFISTNNKKDLQEPGKQSPTDIHFKRGIRGLPGFSKYLSLLLVLAIFTAIFYPFNIMIKVTMDLNKNIINVMVPLQEILSFILIAVLFGGIIWIIFERKSIENFGGYFKPDKASEAKLLMIAFLNSMKFTTIFFVAVQIIFFNDYPLRYPIISSIVMAFVAFGVIIYWIIRKITKNKIIQSLTYSIAIILIIYNQFRIYEDTTANDTFYYGGGYDTIFPFTYLHSMLSLGLVGIALGIVISDFVFNFAFEYTQKKSIDSVKYSRNLIPFKSLFLNLIPFVGAMLIMILNYYMAVPGGDPNQDPNGRIIFNFFNLIIVVLSLISIIFSWGYEILIPWFFKHRRIPEHNYLSQSEGNGKPENETQDMQSQRKTSHKKTNKKTYALLICSLVLISSFGGVSAYTVYSGGYARPIITQSPGDYYVWVLGSSERVAKDIDIAVKNSPIIEAINLSLAKNEYGAIQLVWHPTGLRISDLHFGISDFVHKDNPNEIIGSTNFSVRYLDYVLEGEFPDILKPFSEIDLESEVNNVLWFSTLIPYDTKPGTYNGNITFGFNTIDELTIDFNINVWNFTIPKMRHLRTNIGSSLSHPDAINNYARHRMNDYGIGIPCTLNTGDGTWTFDWASWDAATEAKLNLGMNGFVVGYPYGVSDGRSPYIHDTTRMMWMKNWFQDVQNHLEAKGWLNYSYIYFIDEFQMFIPDGYTRASYFAEIEILLQEIKNAAPKLKIMTTTPPTDELQDIRNYIDIYCPVTSDRNKQDWDGRLAAGNEMWMYPCVQPMAPWPNSHLYNRLFETRALLWQVWQYNLQGFLYWSSSAYFHGRHGLGYNGYGDGWFLYERDGHLYDTPRWENYLDGQEDYEYLWLLNATLNYCVKHPGMLAPSIITEYRSVLDDAVNHIIGEKYEYCDSASIIYTKRDEIGSLLNLLNGIVNTTVIGEVEWFPPNSAS